MGFRNQFAIAGLGYVHGLPDGISARALQAEAARRAIADAGLRREDIGGSIDLKTGPGAGDVPSLTDAFPRVLGLPVSFHFTITRGGANTALGIVSAAKFLELGLADYVVLSGMADDFTRSRTKSGEKGRQVIPKEGYWGIPFGDFRAVTHHCFFAARHMHEFGTTSAQLGAIAVAQREWACRNPDARMYGKPMTLADHQNSPLVVWPYHLLDICQVSDGAVAFVLTTAERARACARPPVYVMGAGFGEAMQSDWWEKKNYARLPVATARQAAFAMAGIELQDLDFAQMYDCFTAEVLFQIEDYGWCAKGEGGPFVAGGHTRPGGRLPINTSGGLLSAYHYADLTGFLEAVLQLRGDAGDRQLTRAEIGLVTGHGGEILSPGMCSIHSTLILRR